MKNIVIVANTYYQLIAAIQMKNTVFLNDKVLLLLSDHSNNSKLIVDELVRHGTFFDTQLLKTKEKLLEKSNFKKIKETIQIALFKTNPYSRLFLDKYNFIADEIIGYNSTIDMDGLYSYFYSKNNNLISSRMEEGLFSYNRPLLKIKRREIISKIRRGIRKKSYENSLVNFYCFFPYLYLGNLKPIKIPEISFHSKTSSELRKTFKLENNFLYKEKYIFFTSIYDFEGGKPVGEYDLVCKIANLVGKDNLLVKIHPRDTRTIYTDNGFNVDKNSSIPWEVIQLSGDFSDKVFMTINSGSVLSGSTMSEKPVRTYYMYKLCDISGNESCQKNARDIENLLQDGKMKNILKTIHIAEKLEDIL